MPVQRDVDILIPWNRDVDGRIDSTEAFNALNKLQRQIK